MIKTKDDTKMRRFRPFSALQAHTAALLVAAVTLFAASIAQAEVRLDITRGKVEPLPIAIPVFFGAEEETSRLGTQIADVISADLQRSGLFRPLDRNAFIQDARSLSVRPRFNEWRPLNAQALVNGRVTSEASGDVRVEFRLWDVFAQSHMLGRALVAKSDNWRRVAHIIADAIYERITGEEGYFDSQIVYVAESGPKTDRTKRLAIMDQDGANHRYLTDGRSRTITPRFSPTRKEIAYLDFYNDTPRVYLFNLETGRREVLGPFEGMTFAPRFSHDGNAVIMSLEQEGNSEIVVMDLRTRKPKQLTNNPAIDTHPSYAPDGNQIVFESDRGGSQQLYVMEADGSNVRRISFGDGTYGTPVWSPRGDLIAFTKNNKGQFYIGVMRPDGTGERLLVQQGYLNEGPTWSPNGRVLMFFREQRGANPNPRIYSVDLTGYNLREVVTPGDASDPAWSPLNR